MKIGLIEIIIGIGVIGIINNRTEYIIIIIALELILIGISIKFIISAYILDDITGIIITILILTLGAAETAIGLSILMLVNTTKTKLKPFNS